MGTGSSKKSRNVWGWRGGSVLALALTLSFQGDAFATTGSTGSSPTGTGTSAGGTTKGSSGRDAGTTDGRKDGGGKGSSNAAGTSRGG
jgi:hypothetical protein